MSGTQQMGLYQQPPNPLLARRLTASFLDPETRHEKADALRMSPARPAKTVPTPFEPTHLIR